jgi:type III pantothenate kinase
MTPFLVADIGNTRIKCARADDRQLHEVISLDSSTPHLWSSGLRTLNSSRNDLWVVASVHPLVGQAFVEQLRAAGSTVRVLESHRDVPLDMDVETPDSVGIDRLLGAFAAKSRTGPAVAAAIVSVGTAVTVDLVDRHGVFRGGAILPGFRLMAQSLNQFTAQLPLVNEWMTGGESPGRNTTAAIRVGIQNAISGGIDRILDSYRRQEPALQVFITGGDARLVCLNAVPEDAGPYLALDGLRRVAMQNHV